MKYALTWAFQEQLSSVDVLHREHQALTALARQGPDRLGVGILNVQDQRHSAAGEARHLEHLGRERAVYRKSRSPGWSPIESGKDDVAAFGPCGSIPAAARARSS